MQPRGPSQSSGAVQHAASAVEATLDRTVDLVTAVVTTVAFWATVTLPAIYVPLAAVGNVDPGAWLVLVAVHACAVVLGHSYRR